jgi:hypothetical protein
MGTLENAENYQPFLGGCPSDASFLWRRNATEDKSFAGKMDGPNIGKRSQAVVNKSQCLPMYVIWKKMICDSALNWFQCD